MKIFTDFKQYSDLWWEAKRGLVTASNMSHIMTPKTMVLSKSADDYMHELIGESVTNHSLVPQGFVSPAMHSGLLLEPEIRSFYEMERNCDVIEVGGCLSDCGRYWCSPDALVGDDGGLEAKGPLPKTHAKYLLDAALPDDYKIQIHGSLIVTGRKWWDFISYVPGMPAFMVRTYPNDFTETLRKCLDEFWDNYQTALRRVRSIGSALEIVAEQNPEQPIVGTGRRNKATDKKNRDAEKEATTALEQEIKEALQ